MKKGCLWTIAIMTLFGWLIIAPTEFLTVLGVMLAALVIIAIISIIRDKNNPKAAQTSNEPEIPSRVSTYVPTYYDYEEQLYDVDFSNPDYDEIGCIQCEDDEIMEKFEEEISRFRICDEDDFEFWYEVEVETYKVYTDKYLRKRIRRRMKEEGLM